MGKRKVLDGVKPLKVWNCHVIGASPNTFTETGNAGGCRGCNWMTIMPVRLSKTMRECVAHIMRKKQHPSITTGLLEFNWAIPQASRIQ
jgi:hypothetical protein